MLTLRKYAKQHLWWYLYHENYKNVFQSDKTTYYDVIVVFFIHLYIDRDRKSETFVTLLQKYMAVLSKTHTHSNTHTGISGGHHSRFYITLHFILNLLYICQESIHSKKIQHTISKGFYWWFISVLQKNTLHRHRLTVNWNMNIV